MGWLSFIPGSTWLRAGLYAAIFGAGWWGGVQWQEGAYDALVLERAEYDRDQARQRAESLEKTRAADQQALEDLSEKLVKAEKSRYRPQEVAADVPNKTDCSLSGVVGVRLDAAAGMSEAARLLADTDALSTVHMDLSQRQVIYWCSDMASLYDECRGRLDSLIQWHR